MLEQTDKARSWLGDALSAFSLRAKMSGLYSVGVVVVEDDLVVWKRNSTATMFGAPFDEGVHLRATNRARDASF